MTVSSRRFVLVFVLLAVAVAVLLWSEPGARLWSAMRGATASAPTPAAHVKRVALLQPNSVPSLDDARHGAIAGLADRGWIEGKNLRLKLYNSEGDMPNAIAMAREMVSGGYDLLFTLTTPSAQVVANVNRAGKTRHVFGLVVDPYAAGILTRSDNPLDHPAHLAGYVTLPQVALNFKMARTMNPALTTVGVVWNPTEVSAESQVKLARIACAELGLKLEEASIENAAGVGEAAAALAARGVEAIWAPADGAVLTALEIIVANAKKAGIPVFSSVALSVRRGTLFDLGANFVDLGRRTGQLAGDILNGRDPATVPIDHLVSVRVALNERALVGLKAKWAFSAAHLAEAQVVIDAHGVEHAKPLASPNSTAKEGNSP
jgi:ABC-type uncharacterized transport system substrate-binding protein